MNLSYWEIKNWLSDITITIVGSGIVGLNAALKLRQKYPKAKILVLERGILPYGASTKNAGFACFGSLSEIVSDLSQHSEQEVFELIEKRWLGLQLLRSELGDKALQYVENGGYELFFQNDNRWELCFSQMEVINKMLRPIFKKDVYQVRSNLFGFDKIRQELLFNSLEGQLDPGSMMRALLKKAADADILVLNNQKVINFFDGGSTVEVCLEGLSFHTKKLCLATNGFASKFVKDVVPARAQVLITEPIADLKINGSFHIDEGYYYFRNEGNSILLGGGRNLDFEGETTDVIGESAPIQVALESLLKDVILPGKSFKIAHRWSGIMGLGSKKYPVVKQLSANVYCGVRLGGMGIAIGTLVGKELANLVSYD
jgi:glycine/D-amino acid oxidase-like deaminating enzyme